MNGSFIRLIRLLAAILLLAAAPVAFAQTPFRIAYNESTASLLPLVRAVYQELGMQPEFVQVPSERAITGADRGDYDADMSRAGSSIRAYTRLMQTSEPLRQTTLYAYARKGSGLTIRNAQELKGRSLGLLQGAKLAEEFVRGESLVAQHGVAPESFYAMLAAGRFDIALVTSIQAATDSKVLQERAERISGPLTTGYSYHVLNKKHAALAPKFDAALLALKKSGQAKRLLPTELISPDDGSAKTSP